MPALLSQSPSGRRKLLSSALAPNPGSCSSPARGASSGEAEEVEEEVWGHQFLQLGEGQPGLLSLRRPFSGSWLSRPSTTSMVTWQQRRRTGEMRSTNGQRLNQSLNLLSKDCQATDTKTRVQ